MSRPAAVQVAAALHGEYALEAHLRDELGHSELSKACPVQAAAASAISVTIGGLIPFLGMLASGEARGWWPWWR